MELYKFLFLSVFLIMSSGCSDFDYNVKNVGSEYCQKFGYERATDFYNTASCGDMWGIECDSKEIFSVIAIHKRDKWSRETYKIDRFDDSNITCVRGLRWI